MNRMPHRKPGPHAQGFTIVETLAVVAIIGVLAAAVLGGLGQVRQRALTAGETAAARTLVAAYTAYAAENDGYLLAGMDGGAKPIKLPDGSTITNKRALMRYPWRLAPYFNYNVQGTLLVGDNIGEVTKTGADYNYAVSAFPVLGMNYLCVGGERSGSGVVQNATECLTRQSQGATSLLVFASAGSGKGQGSVAGYCNLAPPSRGWSASEPKGNYDPASYGHVDPRHRGTAVCGFLDGSVRLMTIEALRDMRLWNKNALAQNDPNYAF